jgi:hypothetical protein
MKQPYEVEAYRPVSKRRRLLLVVLAVATGVSLLGYMRGRKGDIESQGPILPSDVAACKNGKTEGCVGGLAAVIAVPAVAPGPPGPAGSSAASASR